jgi:hypothetical protein
VLSRRRITADGCWEFAGSIDGGGYGNIRRWIDGKEKTLRVHILAAAIWIGPRPEGSFVCHKCDNRRCFNPEHLYYGNGATNSRDMMDRKRGRAQFSSSSTRGEKHWGARLTQQDIVRIRSRITEERRHGILTELAREYGVTIQQISRIKYGRCWSWLQCA